MSDSPKSRAAQKRYAKIVDYKRVFGTEQGKRVLHDMMVAANVLSPMMSKGARGEDLLFSEGQRNVVLRILTFLKTDPEKLIQLMKEGEQG